MENASKALLMAAAILIAILVLTLIIFLFSNFSAIKADNIEKMNQTSLEAFNGKYLAYDGRKDLTYYDIANIATMAKNDNENNGSNIAVYIKNTTNYAKGKNYDNLMKKFINATSIDDSGKDSPEIMEIKYVDDIATGGKKQVKVLVEYKCEVGLSDESGMVKTVRFNNN